MTHDVNQSEMDVATQVRTALVSRVSSERYDLWMPRDAQWLWNDGILQITFASDFSCQIAKKMFGSEIHLAISEVVGNEAEINWSVAVGKAKTIDSTSSPLQRVSRVKPSSEPAPIDGGTPLNEGKQAKFNRVSSHPVAASNWTPPTSELWEKFVQGSSNQLAWTTANLVIAEPGKLSPVLLHGPNGCGKSYLAAAVAERLRSVNRLRRVVHMSSEQFTNDYMEGLRGGGLPMFRRKYRDVEALILDDIQFFVGKKSTIGELKHTLDNLIRLGKQIVLTADCSLSELQGLGSDLVGRLRSGMVTPIFPLDESTRAEVIHRHFKAAGLEISHDIVAQIACRAAGDGRVLSGIAKRMVAVSALHPEKLTWETCWNAVYDLVQATQPIVRIADIEKAICNMFGLEAGSLQSPSKTRNVSQPRMLAMFLSRKYTPAAYKEIGEYFGKRRHSTVISAEKTVGCWLNDDANMKVGRGLTIRDAVRQVEAQLQVG